MVTSWLPQLQASHSYRRIASKSRMGRDGVSFAIFSLRQGCFPEDLSKFGSISTSWVTCPSVIARCWEYKFLTFPDFMCGRLCQDGQLLSRTQVPPPRVALPYHGASVAPGSLSGSPSPAPSVPNTSWLVCCHPGCLAEFSDNKRFTLLSSNQPALLAVPLGARHAPCTHGPSESSLEL